MTEIRMPPGMGCYFGFSQSDEAEIGLNADGTVEISTSSGKQTLITSKAEIARSLYAFGIDVAQPVYVRADEAARYRDVETIIRDLSMRGYERIKLRNTPL
ncbi:biopolymer transporter ExbD [uncultured Brevundimonas sp.]|uniref:biopolymer transporter ExbD n=1 Tax=uncultured Brevundimonas sp. TaxID=213418 RepID=UPI0025D1AF08|nr:biopolymer transporter ExbD [uncultured Brevundimonas sp.]